MNPQMNTINARAKKTVLRPVVPGDAGVLYASSSAQSRTGRNDDPATYTDQSARQPCHNSKPDEGGKMDQCPLPRFFFTFFTVRSLVLFADFFLLFTGTFLTCSVVSLLNNSADSNSSGSALRAALNASFALS
jgi:hypothetical protein